MRRRILLQTCHSSWSTASERNVFIQAMWDDANLHDDMGKPMYIMWAEQSKVTSLKPISPNKNSQIVTNSNGLPFELMKPIISFIMEQSNTYKPINLILEVRARRSYTQRVNQGLAHPIYREIMFLSFVALKRENIDIVAFDSEYQRAFKRISAREERRLHKHDSPLQMSAAACRGQFKELLLIAE